MILPIQIILRTEKNNMAFSYSFKCLSLLLAATSLITLASADQDLIYSICSTTQNPPLCFKVLKSSGFADRRGLGQVLTGVALRKAHKSLNLVKHFAKKATDFRIKGQYDVCLEVYDEALDNLKECKVAFRENRLQDANMMASTALEDIDTCLDAATNVPPQLTQAIKEYENYLDIVLAVSV